MENKSSGPVQTESSKTSGQVICPKCGTPFAAGEKKCPSCGETNRLTLCKSCGAQMAKSAKQCPSCGAKQKKPIYKRVWFWILVVIVVMIAGSSSGKEKQSAASAPTATPQVTNEAVSDSQDTSAQSDTNEFQEAEPTESEAPQEAASKIEQPAAEPEVTMGERNALPKQSPIWTSRRSRIQDLSTSWNMRVSAPRKQPTVRTTAVQTGMNRLQKRQRAIWSLPLFPAVA